MPSHIFSLRVQQLGYARFILGILIFGSLTWEYFICSTFRSFCHRGREIHMFIVTSCALMRFPQNPCPRSALILPRSSPVFVRELDLLAFQLRTPRRCHRTSGAPTSSGMCIKLDMDLSISTYRSIHPSISSSFSLNACHFSSLYIHF